MAVISPAVARPTDFQGRVLPMVKKILAMLLCSICLIFLVPPLYAQGSKHTLTLPNGEVVWDLNGEWDCYTENHGPWATKGSSSDVVKITQSGSSFKGMSMILTKGAEAVRGELDKRGVKWAQLESDEGTLDCIGKISEDGNKMIIDDVVKQRAIFTRK
jgi:hypothetical protein